MGHVLWPALALASGGLFSIGSILIVVLLLNARRGLRKATAYFLGYSGGYLLIGSAILLIGSKLELGRPSAQPSWISLGLNLLVGGLLLFFAQKRLRTPPKENPEPPKFLASVDKLTAPKALGFGLLVTCLNFKNLAIFVSAVAVVLSGDLPLEQALLLNVAIVAVFCAMVGLPILLYLAFLEKAELWLHQGRIWLEQNNRPFSIALMLFFGVFFVLKGLHPFLWRT